MRWTSEVMTAVLGNESLCISEAVQWNYYDDAGKLVGFVVPYEKGYYVAYKLPQPGEQVDLFAPMTVAARELGFRNNLRDAKNMVERA